MTAGDDGPTSTPKESPMITTPLTREQITHAAAEPRDIATGVTR